MTRKSVSLVVVILSALVCFSLMPARAALTAPTFIVNSPADIVASAPLDNGVRETAPGNGRGIHGGREVILSPVQKGSSR